MSTKPDNVRSERFPCLWLLLDTARSALVDHGDYSVAKWEEARKELDAAIEQLARSEPACTSTTAAANKGDTSTPWTLHTDGVITCADGLSPFSRKRSPEDRQAKKVHMVRAVNANDLLAYSCSELLGIVEDEYAHDSAPEELTSWKRAIDNGHVALNAASEV